MTEEKDRGKVTKGTVLAWGTILNLAGQGVSLSVAVLCMPGVIDRLGVARFGVLALSWALLNYIGTFDLGLGRAATRFISASIGRGALDDVPRYLGSALFVQGLLGAAGGVLIFSSAPIVVAQLFALPEYLRPEARDTLRIIAVATPIVMLLTSMRGALAAIQRFDLLNAVGVPSSSSMFVLSAAGAYAGWSLPVIVSLLVASKAVTLAAYWLLVRRHCPGLAGRRLAADPRTFGLLLRFGSWMSVSSAIVPLLQRAERLLIPALVSIEALAFYTVPYEALSRAAVLPISMAVTLFPAFSRLGGFEGPALTDLVARPMKYLMLAMTPALLAVGLFTHELLAVWAGVAFADQAAPALRFLAAGFYFNMFSYILRPAVQGLGRPDLKAKLDMTNAVLFVVLLFLLGPRFGLAGIAAAKMTIMLAELTGLVVLVARVAPTALRPAVLLQPLRPALALTAAFATAAFAATAWLRGSLLAYGAFAAITMLYAIGAWIWLADARDRRGLAHARAWIGSQARWSPAGDES